MEKQPLRQTFNERRAAPFGALLYAVVVSAMERNACNMVLYLAGGSFLHGALCAIHLNEGNMLGVKTLSVTHRLLPVSKMWSGFAGARATSWQHTVCLGATVVFALCYCLHTGRTHDSQRQGQWNN